MRMHTHTNKNTLIHKDKHTKLIYKYTMFHTDRLLGHDTDSLTNNQTTKTYSFSPSLSYTQTSTAQTRTTHTHTHTQRHSQKLVRNILSIKFDAKDQRTLTLIKHSEVKNYNFDGKNQRTQIKKKLK